MGKNIYMWAALALVLLAACQKTPQSGQVVRFTAVSKAEPVTKTGYTGDKDGNKERIDWKTGDAIRIYSDRATASNNNTYKWADYTVSGSPINSGATSKADISVTSAQGGLTWIDDDAHAFYAIYPSPGGGDASDIKGTSTAPFSGNIPAGQNGTEVTGLKPIADDCLDHVYYPPMDNAYMVAFKSLSNSVSKAYLDFEPAYTAFHICAGYKDTDITLKSVELSSVSSALTGDFEMYYDSGSWTYPPVARDPGYNDKITFKFKDGDNNDKDITLNSTNPKVEFVLFALPQDLSGLTLKFNVEIGSEAKYRTLELKSIAGNAWIDFYARHKALLKGLLIPGATWTINNTTEIKMQESVADWDDATITPVEYGTSGIIFNATGLNQTGTGGKSFDFSLFAPAGKTWKVTARNASNGSVATDVVLKPETGPDSTGGVLSGTIGSSNPWIHFTAESGTSGENYYLTFSVDVDGTEYSIDSEVARGGWGPGKSYSYFSFSF